jgi:hypothetical protein
LSDLITFVDNLKSSGTVSALVDFNIINCFLIGFGAFGSPVGILDVEGCLDKFCFYGAITGRELDFEREKGYGTVDGFL